MLSSICSSRVLIKANESFWWVSEKREHWNLAGKKAKEHRMQNMSAQLRMYCTLFIWSSTQNHSYTAFSMQLEQQHTVSISGPLITYPWGSPGPWAQSSIWCCRQDSHHQRCCLHLHWHKGDPRCHWESERWITSQITNPSTSRPWYHPSVKCFHKGCIANHFILKSYLSNNRYCQEKEKPIEPTPGRWWEETSAAPHVREESLSQWGSQTRTWIPSELHWSALELLSLLRRGHSKEILL